MANVKMSAMSSADILEKMSEEELAKLNKLLTPRMVDKYVPHVPHPPQQIFLGLDTREAMFGGAGGGGKSDALLMAALQYVDVPGYNALILRKTYQDLILPEAIMDRARSWLSGTDAKAIDGGRIWRFPSGARLTFGYLQTSKDKYRYQGAAFQYVGFDEVTQFLEEDYKYLFSRLRRPTNACMVCDTKLRRHKYSGAWIHDGGGSMIGDGVRCKRAVPNYAMLDEYQPAPDGLRLFDVPTRMRSASNPGGTGHAWVRDRYVDKEKRHKSAVFIPAKISDNPSLDQQEYINSLAELSTVDRERMMNGDWAVLEAGNMFQRHWFPSVKRADVPSRARFVRFWDLAATVDGDYTVGAKVAMLDGVYWVTDIFRQKLTPHEVEKAVARTAMQDGDKVMIYMEQEPGSAGLSLMDHYRRNILAGYRVKPVKSSTSKELRATPLSSLAEAGKVFLVDAKWNVDFMDEASVFPYGVNDDQVDGVAGAVNALRSFSRSKIIV
jgi:predicted phage terminase large subunit-like protein